MSEDSPLIVPASGMPTKHDIRKQRDYLMGFNVTRQEFNQLVQAYGDIVQKYNKLANIVNRQGDAIQMLMTILKIKNVVTLKDIEAYDEDVKKFVEEMKKKVEFLKTNKFEANKETKLFKNPLGKTISFYALNVVTSDKIEEWWLKEGADKSFDNYAGIKQDEKVEESIEAASKEPTEELTEIEK